MLPMGGRRRGHFVINHFSSLFCHINGLEATLSIFFLLACYSSGNFDVSIFHVAVLCCKSYIFS